MNMDKSKHVFIVRVDMRRVKTELRYKKTIYPAMKVKTPKNLEELYNRAQALDFEGDIMTFVIDRVRETPSQYHVMFEGQAFHLDKRNLDDRWFRFNDVFEFRLCKTALEMWQAIYSYYHNLHEQVMKSRTGAPTSEWQMVDEDPEVHGEGSQSISLSELEDFRKRKEQKEFVEEIIDDYWLSNPEAEADVQRRRKERELKEQKEKRKHVLCLYCGKPINLSKGKHHTVEYTDRNGELVVEYYCRPDHAPNRGWMGTK